ncbi:hypothetical protein BM613_08020 [Sulfoacidibacillus thermotolerans]|uniref:ABC transporter domain-containing protein n=1 Tax=Sulfoacidibacillus thermotolerans TaxID=1765684 RepID=A0A2U3D8F3_SULT2|nr:hypothetical protein BM613_08020 [Sulfoacidibacillus thermotolerans]
MTILEAIEISIGYRGHQVIENASLKLDQGQFVSLIGPNGAGKTTLLNALGGQLRIQTGDIQFEGKSIANWSADRRARAGIGRSFQAVHLFPNLTTEQNIQLAVQAKRRLRLHHLLGKVDQEVTAATRQILNEIGLLHVARVAAKALSHGDKRKLELAMLLSLQPRVLLLDEPTAGMSMTETPMMLKLIAQLKATGHYAILLVEHKIDMVMQLSDRIVVLHQGHILAQGTPSEVMNDQEVTNAYLGGHYEGIT